MEIWDVVDQHLMTGPGLRTERMPTFYPSAAACIDQTDRYKIIGGCNRAQYYRCAGYEKSNPSGLFSQYIFAGGNMWEDWLIEQLKQSGVWVSNSLKFQEIPKNISGEIDVVVKDPFTSELMIVECKTYSSSNYKAKKEICGTKRFPKCTPKDQNVLQAFLYLGKFAEQGIKKSLLVYFDRACGGPDNNKQFTIEVHTENELRYPKISYNDHNGVPVAYVDYRITLEAIYERYAALKESLIAGEIPRPAYAHVFTDSQVREKHGEGLIAKTKMENWERNKEKYPIGDWQCFYCDYADSCKAHQEEANGS